MGEQIAASYWYVTGVDTIASLVNEEAAVKRAVYQPGQIVFMANLTTMEE